MPAIPATQPDDDGYDPDISLDGDSVAAPNDKTAHFASPPNEADIFSAMEESPIEPVVFDMTPINFFTLKIDSEPAKTM